MIGRYDKSPRRRGTVYMLVLMSAMIVSILGVSAIMAVRVRMTSINLNNDLAQARLYAKSGVEMAMYIINDDPYWRTKQPNGTWQTDKPIGNGTYTIEVIDPADGDLTNDLEQPILITATGTAGQARYKLAVQAAPHGPPGMDCLTSAAHAVNYVFNIGDTNANAPISSNGNIKNHGFLRNDVEYVNMLLNNGFITGSIMQIAAKATPSITDIISAYSTMGTNINLADIPSQTIEEVLISPTSNPYGSTTDPNGIYRIDCQNQTIKIKNSRILGTLILLNVGINSKIEEQVHWSPAQPDLPAMVVTGSIKFNNESTLDEDQYHVNFNPPGSPYDGVEDDDQTDIYPSVIKGLVYVSGLCKINKTSTFEGVVIAGSQLQLNDSPSFTYDPTIIHNPPPAFRVTRPMFFINGTWQQIVD